jgi:hypothetical protein
MCGGAVYACVVCKVRRLYVCVTITTHRYPSLRSHSTPRGRDKSSKFKMNCLSSGKTMPFDSRAPNNVPFRTDYALGEVKMASEIVLVSPEPDEHGYMHYSVAGINFVVPMRYETECPSLQEYFFARRYISNVSNVLTRTHTHTTSYMHVW